MKYIKTNALKAMRTPFLPRLSLPYDGFVKGQGAV